MTLPAGYQSTADAAATLGLSRRHVQLIAGQLGLGARVGRTIILSPADIAAMAARNTRPGPRPNATKEVSP